MLVKQEELLFEIEHIIVLVLKKCRLQHQSALSYTRGKVGVITGDPPHECVFPRLIICSFGTKFYGSYSPTWPVLGPCLHFFKSRKLQTSLILKRGHFCF